MKIARITYLFALCPALLVGMTSCGSNNNLPGRALSYEEVYEQVKKTAPEYNMRTSLSKGIDVTLGIDYFTIDGKVTLPMGEPTNIRFTIPKQDDFKLTLKNETGVKGALEIRERLSQDVPSAYTNSGEQFGGNFLYNCLFNPFFTTYTLSYLHSMIDAVSDIKIVNESYSLDGETVYVSYSIPDLKTFTELAEEYELGQMTKLFTVFRGTDGNVRLTLSFDKYGYLSSLALKADSNDIALIGDSESSTENFRGYAHVSFAAKIKQKFYSESDYHGFSAVDYSSNNNLNIRKVSSSEYEELGFKTRELDVKFVQDVLDNYSDVILPGYGADFVIEHPGKDSSFNNMMVDIDGIGYPITDFIAPAKNSIVYSWTANNATTSDGVTSSGRSIIENDIFIPKYYFAKENYTLLPHCDMSSSHNASLLEEMLKLKTSNGHARSSINYMAVGNFSIAKEFIRFNYYEDPLGLFSGREFTLDRLPYGKQNFSTEISALPWGYAHYNFRMPDGGNNSGIWYRGGQCTTRTAFAEIDDNSHGILDVYNNLNADGSYTVPTIKAANGFKINTMYATEDSLKDAIIDQIVKTEPEYGLNKDQINVEFVKDSKGNNIGFTFTISSDYIEKSKGYTSQDELRAASFRLIDFEYDNGAVIENPLFIRDDNDTDLEVGDNCYIIFDLVKDDGVSLCYNPLDGLEEITIKATVDEIDTRKVLKFDDFTIAVDDGYQFLEKDAIISDFASYYFSSNDNKYISNDSLRDYLRPFVKLSSDKKYAEFSMNNCDEKTKIESLNNLYNYFSGKIGIERCSYAKVMYNQVNSVIEEQQPLMLNDEKIAYMNVVPGPDYTYVQILPIYTEALNKDLKFVFDF